MNAHNKSKLTSNNNVLPMHIIIFNINTNSYSADRIEGTDLDALSDFEILYTKKLFLIS